MSSEIQITLPPDIAAIVVNEAARAGKTTTDVVSDAIQRAYSQMPEVGVTATESESESKGRTLADRLRKHIGALNSAEFIPGGAQLSVDTHKKYSGSLYEEHLRKRQP
jgi:hypothetical protein